LLGYVNSLSAGPSSGATGFSFFKLSCTLTPSGLDNYQSVVSTIFSYLALLAAAPSQALRDAYAENHQTRRLEFAYLEKSSSASRYASNLATRLSGPWPREEVVSSAHIVREEFDEELFRGAVESLRKAGECRVMVAGWEMPKAAKAKWDRKEDIYGTEFRLEKFGEEFEKSCLEPPVVPELHLPGPNIFIPTNFEVDKIEDVKVRSF
jgi:insulysin